MISISLDFAHFLFVFLTLIFVQLNNLNMFSETLHEICWSTDFLWSMFSCIWKESYLYFPVLGQIWEHMDTILSTYEKIQIRESPYFGIFMQWENRSWIHGQFTDLWKYLKLKAMDYWNSTFPCKFQYRG